jgi:hypothetical protein
MPTFQYTFKSLFASMSIAFMGISAAYADIQRYEAQTSYESWSLPQGESMGMQRFGLKQSFGPYLNAGVDAFTAVQGERGGFITLGISGGVTYPITRNLSLESDLHIGAGGGRGGYELAGGGLLLRESMGLRYQLPVGSVSVGMSRVDFPNNGVIKNNQMYLGYNLAFNALMEPGYETRGKEYVSGLNINIYEPRMHEFSIHYRDLSVSQGTKTDSGGVQEGFGLMGAQWRTYLNQNWFTQIESAGAMQGNSRGYMHILAGGGYQLPLTDNLYLNTALAVGGGGGGSVDTGGGLLWDASLSLQYFLTKRWFVDLSASRLWAASTPFESNTYGLKLGYQFGSFAKADSTTGIFNQNFDSHPLRVRMVNQTYTKASENWRNRPDQNVSNLGVQLDYFVEPHLYLTGQGLGAHTGDAGAYMTGLIGAGIRQDITKKTFLELEGLVGAAGGGGLNTGSGMVYQGNLNLGYQLNKSLSLIGSYGQMKAANGDFHAHVYGLSLAYQFNALSARSMSMPFYQPNKD